MTDTTQWAPPPPERKKRKWPLFGGGAVALLAIGAAAGARHDTVYVTVGTDAPATTVAKPKPTTTTAKSTTTTAVDEWLAWLIVYADESVAFSSRIASISDDVATAARATDLVGVLTACTEGVDYVAAIASSQMTAAAPDLFGEAVDAYGKAYGACADGDFDQATFWTEKATAKVQELTAIVTSYGEG